MPPASGDGWFCSSARRRARRAAGTRRPRESERGATACVHCEGRGSMARAVSTRRRARNSPGARAAPREGRLPSPPAPTTARPPPCRHGSVLYAASERRNGRRGMVAPRGAPSVQRRLPPTSELQRPAEVHNRHVSECGDLPPQRFRRNPYGNRGLALLLRTSSSWRRYPPKKWLT